MDDEEKITVTLSDGGVQYQAQLPATVPVLEGDGKIVSVSTKKIIEKTADVLAVFEVAMKGAVDRLSALVPGGPNGPSFKLDEITVGLNVSAEAGVIIAGVGAEANLSLKFARVGGATA